VSVPARQLRNSLEPLAHPVDAGLVEIECDPQTLA